MSRVRVRVMANGANVSPQEGAQRHAVQAVGDVPAVNAFRLPDQHAVAAWFSPLYSVAGALCCSLERFGTQSSAHVCSTRSDGGYASVVCVVVARTK